MSRMDFPGHFAAYFLPHFTTREQYVLYSLMKQRAQSKNSSPAYTLYPYDLAMYLYC